MNVCTLRGRSISGERGINCPRTQTVSGFRPVFVKKSRKVQCTRGFVRFWGLNFDGKNVLRSSRIVLGFWRHGPTGLKMGALGMRFPV